MSVWERLAEARMQEWLRRPPQERASAPAPDPVAPLEVQLLESIVQLYKEASTTRDEGKAQELRRQGASQETRLLTIHETSGRPLAAQHFAKLLLEARLQKG